MQAGMQHALQGQRLTQERMNRTSNLQRACHVPGLHLDPTNPWLPWNHCKPQPSRCAAGACSTPRTVRAAAKHSTTVTGLRATQHGQRKRMYAARCTSHLVPAIDQPQAMDLPSGSRKQQPHVEQQPTDRNQLQEQQQPPGQHQQQPLEQHHQQQQPWEWQEQQHQHHAPAYKGMSAAEAARQAWKAAAQQDPLVIAAFGEITEGQKQLTRLLRGSVSIRVLQGLVRGHMAIMNSKHVAAVLTRLRQLGANGTWREAEASGPGEQVARGQLATEARTWLATFLPATQHLITHFTMLEIAGSLYALARLDARPPLAWMDALLAVASAYSRGAPRLADASPAQLGTTLWALGRLGCDPGAGWLDLACDASITMMRLRPDRHVGPRDARGAHDQAVSLKPAALESPTHTSTAAVSNVQGAAPFSDSQPIMGVSGMHGENAPVMQNRYVSAPAHTTAGSAAVSGQIELASPPVRPSQRDPDAWELAQEDSRNNPNICSDTTLVAMVWGLAKLQHNVPERWRRAICSEMAARWWFMDAQCTSNLAWALATLAVHPRQPWLREFNAVSYRLLPTASSYDLSMLLWSQVIWGQRPRYQWLGRFFAASSRTLPTAEPEHIARCLWCCASLRLRPPGLWLRRVLQQTQVQAFDFNGQAIANSLWALAKLSIMPPTEWLETLLVASYEQGLEGWGPQELSNTMWALGRWRHAPEPAWADLFWSEAFVIMAQFSPQQQVNVLWGAVRAGQAPPPQCLNRLLKVSFRSLDRHSLLGAATLLTCFGQLEQAPPGPWMKAFFESTLPKIRRYAAGIDSNTSSRVAFDSADSTHEGGLSEIRDSIHERGQPGPQGAVPEGGSLELGVGLHEGSVHTHDGPDVPSSVDASMGAECDQGDAGVTLSSGASHTSHEAGDGTSPIADEDGADTAVSGSGMHGVDSGTIVGFAGAHGGVGGRATGSGAGGVGAVGPGGAYGLMCEKLIAPLAILRIAPPEEWAEAFLSMSLAAMPSMRQGNLASVAYGVVLLGLKPSPAWVEALVQAADKQLGPGGAKQVNRISLGKLLYAVRQLPGAQAAYQRWRKADWIADALELYEP